MEPIFYSTREIAEALKINPRQIPHYVKKYGLPAFKDSDSEKAAWKATRANLEAWAADYERKMLAKNR